MMRQRAGILTLLFVLTIAHNPAVAQTSQSVSPVRTLGLTLGGTALLGAGITYDHSYAHAERGYAYWRGEMSFQYLWEPGLFPSIGAGYCRSLSKNQKFFMGAGLNVGGLIAFKPTPKHIREYWDSIEFYGGNYVYPVELFVMPELSFSYIAKRWFVRAQLPALFIYDRVGQNQIRFIPWAGITVGFRFGSK